MHRLPKPGDTQGWEALLAAHHVGLSHADLVVAHNNADLSGIVPVMTMPDKSALLCATTKCGSLDEGRRLAAGDVWFETRQRCTCLQHSETLALGHNPRYDASCVM